MRPWLRFLNRFGERLRFGRYTKQTYSCVGFYDGDTLVKGWPARAAQPLINEQRCLQVIRHSADAGLLSLAALSPETIDRLSLRTMTFWVAHFCEVAPSSARFRKGQPDTPGHPAVFLTESESSRELNPPPESAWGFFWAMVRLHRSLGAARVAPPLSASVLSSMAPGAAINPSAAADAATVADGFGDVPPMQIDDGTSSDDGFVEPIGLRGTSFVDLPEDGRYYTTDPMPQVVWARPDHAAICESIRPAYANFNVVLEAWYNMPQAADGAVFHKWLKELTAGRGRLTPASFHELRRMNVEDKTVMPPTMWSDAAGRVADVTAPAGAAKGVFGQRRCVVFAVRDVRIAVEAHISRMIARGALDMPGSGPLVMMLYGDGAGRKVNDHSVWLLSVIPLNAKRTGALDSVCPLAMAVGSFLIGPRTTLQDYLAPQLSALRELSVGFRKLSVIFRNFSDLSDAVGQYATESLARPNAMSFITAPNKPAAARFLTAMLCPSCASTAADVCALPSRPLPEREVAPSWRITDGLGPAIWHRYGRLHSLLHGLPVLLAEIAILFHRLGHTRIARWICTALPRTQGFEPHVDIYAGEEPPAGSPQWRKARASREKAWQFASLRPPHSCRPKDVKDFIRKTARTTTLVKEVVLSPEAPPRRFAASATDVLDLINMAEPEVTVPTHRGPLHVSRLYEATLAFFSDILDPTEEVFGTMEGRSVCRARGEAAFEGLKYVCAANQPVDLRDRANLKACKEAMVGASEEEVENVVASVRFHWSKVALGPAAHVAYMHPVDIFDDFPFDLARRATEEGFEHFFTYLYDTVPVLEPRLQASSWGAAAEAIWRCTLECTQVGVPAGERRNTAYGA